MANIGCYYVFQEVRSASDKRVQGKVFPQKRAFAHLSGRRVTRLVKNLVK